MFLLLIVVVGGVVGFTFVTKFIILDFLIYKIRPIVVRFLMCFTY